MGSRASALLALVWTAALSLATGVLVRPSLIAFPWLVIALGALFLRRRGIAVYAGLIALGLVAGHAVSSADRDERALIERLGESVPRCSVAATVAERAGGLGTLLRIDRMQCDDRTFVEPGVVITDELEHDPGTRLRGEGWLIPFTDDSFDQARKRAGAGAAFHASELVRLARPPGVLGFASRFRTSLADSTEHLEVRTGALLRGLTIGDTSEIDPTMEEQFRRTGLSHLVAVSGSNVAVVVAAASLFVRRARPAVRTVCCGLVLAFYVLVVGPEPSVLRAAAMGGVALAGILWGRRSEPLQALGVALVILLALRPHLVTSVGLGLSAAATLGIVLWARPLMARFRSVLPAPVALVLAATIAAQIAVAPLLIGVFEQVSLVAPLANVLAAVAVAPATILGLAAGCLGLVSPALGSWTAALAAPFAAWIVRIAAWLATPGWASAACPSWVGWALAAPVVLVAVRSATHSYSGVPALD